MRTEIKDEVWKLLVVEDLHASERYEISNFGRVKSFKSNPEGYILKTSLLKGYNVVSILMNNNCRTTRYVHKLVAEHFILRENEMQEYVIHIDFDKNNNHYANLRWVTRTTMFAHQKINPNYKRGMVSNSKLTEAEVKRIKKKLKLGKTKLYKIAEEFGITHTQLNRIRNGENWSKITID